MMTADELFKASGYDKTYETDQKVVYSKKHGDYAYSLILYRNGQIISKVDYALESNIAATITFEVLDAINAKLAELGWK